VEHLIHSVFLEASIELHHDPSQIRLDTHLFT